MPVLHYKENDAEIENCKKAIMFLDEKRKSSTDEIENLHDDYDFLLWWVSSLDELFERLSLLFCRALKLIVAWIIISAIIMTVTIVRLSL